MSQTYSVVIPAYNAEHTIDACLASVMEQTLAPVQVLIIDDCSGDGTEAAVRRWQERFVSAGIEFEFTRLPGNSGPSTARNQGIRHAKGSYIAFLDADDVWTRDKLEIVDRFLGDSAAGLVCHAYAEPMSLRAETQTAKHEVRPLLVYGMLWRNRASSSCAIMRRQNGLNFDEAMRYCEDYDLWMRIAEHSTVLWLEGPPLTLLGRAQLSSGGLSASTLRMRAGQLRVYYKFCSRNWLRRGWLLPPLALFSLLKHLYSMYRRRTGLLDIQWRRP